MTLQEIKSGPLGADKLRDIRDKGWTEDPCTRTQIMIDAKSVYESLKATMFKAPAEHSLAGHVLWLREMHDKGLVSDFTWVDTRDVRGRSN